MTDKEIERFLNLLQKTCKTTQCEICPFNMKEEDECMFTELGNEIACEPCAWNVNDIMTILKGDINGQ